MFILFFILSAAILASGSLYLLFKWKNKTSNRTNLDKENAAYYLYADKIFVRDPEAFKDKDKDGIDDIIDDRLN